MTDPIARILAIDDTPANLRTLGAALAEEFELQTVTTGQQGLALAAADPPDLILVDVMMPGMNGYEVCRRLKEDERLRQIPVIFVTALGEFDSELTGLTLGAADYLTKPINVDLARHRIRNLVNRERLRREVEAQRDQLESLVQARTATLQASEQRLRLAQQAARAATWEWRLADEAIYWSEEMWSLYGLEPNSLEPSVAIWRHIVDPDDRDPAERLARDAIAAEREFEVEWRLRDSGDPPRWILSRAQPVRDPSGQVSHFAGINIDISVRKQAEIARQTALDAAARLLNLKAELLRNLSHELRTPLNGIFGFASLGQRVGDLQKARGYFNHILQAGQELFGLVENLLTIAHMEKEPFALARDRHRLAEVLDAAVQPRAAKAQAKGLTFADLRDPSLPGSCILDGERVTQILNHLLSNAVKFTAEGDVSLYSARDGGHLLFRVLDTGIGMDPAQVARLFQPFQQGDGSMTRRHGGLGLGLALAHNLVERMGGTLTVTSQLGRGSSFEVRIPCEAPEEPAEPGSGRRLEGIQILLVGDTSITGLIVTETLEAEGARITPAGTSAAALECLRGNPPYGAVIIAGILWDLDVFELIHRMECLAPHLPVLVVDADPPEEDGRPPPPTDAAQFLDIPLDIPLDREEIVARLEQMTRRSP